MTYFEHNKFRHRGEDAAVPAFPSWSLLAAEVEETGMLAAGLASFNLVAFVAVNRPSAGAARIGLDR